MQGAAHFSAQLPLLLRGVFFGGWSPAKVPVKFDAEQFLVAMAQDSRLSLDQTRRRGRGDLCPRARMSPGQLDHLLAQLPRPLRAVLAPDVLAESERSRRPGP